MAISGSMKEVETVIRHSEVMAVVRAMQSSHAPAVGNSLDYFIEVPSHERPYTSVAQGKGRKPYRFKVEQWHLNAASLVVMAGA
jgi:hypothetical protein